MLNTLSSTASKKKMDDPKSWVVKFLKAKENDKYDVESR